jgi:hypothetical protein
VPRVTRQPPRPFCTRCGGSGKGRLLSAVALDLGGHSAERVAVDLLQKGPRLHPDRSRRLTESQEWSAIYPERARGRDLLAQLGCWPWAFASGGKLPRKWRRDPAFIEPLQALLEARGSVLTETRQSRA